MGNPTSKKGGGGGGDMMLESRHLIGIFLGLVVICGVFFTLGYVMGRAQFETSVSAATIGKADATPVPRTEALGKRADTSAAAAPTPAPVDWAFPSATDAKRPADRLEPPSPKSPSAAASRASEMKVALNPAPGKRESSKPALGASAPTPANNSKMKPPSMPRGSIVLQIAALSKESDALALAEALQQKKFPAYVLQPMGDKLYRVQVGPYPNSASAEAGKKALYSEGFKAILKK